VLADVACLRGKDDEGVALRRHHDVGVPVDDLEPGEVRDRPLEPRVLAPGDDEAVERVLRHRATDLGEASMLASRGYLKSRDSERPSCLCCPRVLVA